MDDEDIQLNVEDGIYDEGLAHTSPLLVSKMKQAQKALTDAGYSFSITGGWRDEDYNAQVNGAADSRHLHGDAIDWDTDAPDDVVENLAQQLGISWYDKHDKGSGMHWHWDIRDITDGDGNDEPTDKSSNIFNSVMSVMGDKVSNYEYAEDEMPDEVDYAEEYAKTDPSFGSTLWANFMDSATSSGAAYALESLWGKVAHSSVPIGNFFKPIDQTDIDFVKASLPDDKEAQQYCLLNGRDSEEVRWLVNQKLVEKNRRTQIQQWRDKNDSVLKSAMMYGVGASGYLLDPMMYLPIGEAYNGAKLLTRLGEAGIQDVPKAMRIAAQAATVGGEQMAVQMLDDAVRDINGQEVNYGFDSAMAFLGGALVSHLGGFFKGMKDKRTSNIVANADKLETMAMKNALDLHPKSIVTDLMNMPPKTVPAIVSNDLAVRASSDMAVKGESAVASKAESAIDNIADTPKDVVVKEKAGTLGKHKSKNQVVNDPEKYRYETYGLAKKLHDEDFMKGRKSNAYQKLADKGRVIATTWQKAHDLVKEVSGIEIPQEAKAFYVPNEDYIMLLTDRVQPKDVDKVLLHEFGVHAGLKNMMPEREYDSLMQYIIAQSNIKQTKFYKAKILADSYDPEEILAYAVENGMLPKRFKRFMMKMLHFNTNIRIGEEDIVKLLNRQLEEDRKGRLGIYFNDDGSTAFAGLQFSKDNALNANTWTDAITLEDITNMTQGDIGTHLPKILASPVRKLTQLLETGIGGEARNSVSPTARTIATFLFDDARGRGLGADLMQNRTMTADTEKMLLQSKLNRYVIDYKNIRMDFIQEQKGRFKALVGRKEALTFDRMVYDYYNAKYAGNVATAMTDVPESVKRAAEVLKKMREEQIELGKRSGEIAGSTSNLIEKDWYVVDDELWRQVDMNKRNALLDHYLCSDTDTIKEDLRKYVMTYAKRDKIRDMLEREEKLRVARLKRSLGDSAPTEADIEAMKLKPVTDKAVEKWLNKSADAWVTRILKGTSFDITSQKIMEGSTLGDLNFLRARIPMDTTGVMTFNAKNNPFTFSFDNNLRDFDLDTILHRNINRFSGEASVLAAFKSPQAMEDMMKRMETELQQAKGHGVILQNKVDTEMEHMRNSIMELRGMRPPDTTMGRMGAIMRIFQNLSYAKNGANMLFAQLGEVGGTMAYGGTSQLMRVFKPLGEFMENCKMGKVTADTIRDVEDYVFGKAIEAEIWGYNYGDRAIRDCITTPNVIDRAIRGAGSFVADMGKLTSTLNMLPKMTDSMERGMRIQTIMDSLKWAKGEEISKFRNPFSKAKLKGAYVTDADVQAIKDSINKYARYDEKGNLVSFNIEAWEKEDPLSFGKWVNIVKRQQERAIVSGQRISNRTFFKEANAVTRMLFQFKDYTLRAINGQTLRAMTASDLDDALSTCLSVITNTMTSAIRAGAIYGAMKLTGMDKKADEYYDKMFNQDMLTRAIAFRSTILGSPLSFANDIYELGTGAPSIRTTVTRDSYKQKDRTPSDVFGDAIAQSPAVKEMVGVPYQFYKAMSNAADDKMTKGDLQRALQILPIPNFIPFTTLTTKLVDEQSLPTQRPKPKKRKRRNK